MTEEELRKQLQKTEEEREEFERIILQIQREEEESEEQDHRAYLETEQMREDCTPEDWEILQLLDEKQELYTGIKKRRRELAEELQETMKKKNREMDMKEEDIYFRIQVLQDEKEQREE